MLAGLGLTAVAGTLALASSVVFIGTGTITASLASSGVAVWSISAFGVTAFGTVGLANTGGVIISTGAGSIGVGLAATVGSIFALIGGVFIAFQIDKARRQVSEARDLIFKAAQPEIVRPRQPNIPAQPESGILIQLRRELADWEASSLGRSNFQPIVSQALTFRNVVSGQVTRTDCR